MKQLLFYATKEDLLPVLEQVEEEGLVAYVRTGHYSKPQAERYERGADLPRLGEASADSAIACDSFLVCPADQHVRPKAFTLNTGVKQFAVDQLLNPDTVELMPAGLRGSDVLLYGRVATVSSDKPAQALMRRFQRALRKRFAKIKAFYVGPRAEALRAAGTRLTIGVHSPRDYDLKP